MTTLIVTIALTLVGASVSFVGIILSKEQRVSEFRLSWLEALREDIACLIARALAIHEKNRNAVGYLASDSPLGMKLSEDFLEINKVSVRIRLRLNPNKEAQKAVILLLDESEKLFAMDIEKNPFGQIDDLTTRITSASQKLLRSVWDEVKRGEPAFQMAKWTALGIALLALALLACGLYFQVRLANQQIPPAPKCAQQITP